MSQYKNSGLFLYFHGNPAVLVPTHFTNGLSPPDLFSIVAATLALTKNGFFIA
jgi:hypothetical protein